LWSLQVVLERTYPSTAALRDAFVFADGAPSGFLELLPTPVEARALKVRIIIQDFAFSPLFMWAWLHCGGLALDWADGYATPSARGAVARSAQSSPLRAPTLEAGLLSF
jgi:hypothetical protein